MKTKETYIKNALKNASMLHYGIKYVITYGSSYIIELKNGWVVEMDRAGGKILHIFEDKIGKTIGGLNK